MNRSNRASARRLNYLLQTAYSDLDAKALAEHVHSGNEAIRLVARQVQGSTCGDALIISDLPCLQPTWLEVFDKLHRQE